MKSKKDYTIPQLKRRLSRALKLQNEYCYAYYELVGIVTEISIELKHRGINTTFPMTVRYSEKRK